MDFLPLAMAAVLGALVAAVLARSRARRQLAETRAEIAADLAAARQDNRWLSEEVARQKQALGDADALLDAANVRLRDTFQALASDALKDNRAAFLDLARTSFAGFQQPLTDTLKRVDARLAEAERDRVAAYARLSEQVAQLGSATSTLSRALRTPTARGRWGEMQLRRVVEIAGMQQRCDFDEQRSVAGENGRQRPDLIVHLPGGKQLIVDAKAPLEAFLDAQETADDDRRAERLRAHAQHVRQHMEKLGSKAYWESLGDSPDMVVLFLPGETLFSTALQHDLTLIEHGLRQRVLLASPITLIALLTTVAHSWRQEALADNYREVARLGREFYDRLATFADHFDEVRKRLDGAVQAYNSAAGSFETRVLVSARRLKELNLTTEDDLPAAAPVDTVPRVLRQAGLMGLPEGATTTDEPESL
jgi:DNA recombination protein RmuC